MTEILIVSTTVRLSIQADNIRGNIEQAKELLTAALAALENKPDEVRRDEIVFKRMAVQDKIQEIINTTSSADFIEIMMSGDAKLLDFLKSGDQDARDFAILIKQEQVNIYRKIKEREAAELTE